MRIFETSSKSIGEGDPIIPLFSSQEVVSDSYWNNTAVALALGPSTGEPLDLKAFKEFEIWSESVERVEYGVEHMPFEITAIAIQDATPVLPEPLTFYWG